MKSMKNNKGFSLIEILATIVILAIVSTVGIVSINRMISNSREHYYESQEKQMILAAQSYANDNRNILPRNVGGMQKIKLSTLRDKNYLKEDIVDQDKNPCYKDKSYVTIYKSSRTEFKYKGYLECPACKKNGSTTCYTSKDKQKPVVNITLPNVTNGNELFANDKKFGIQILSLQETDKYPTVNVASYSYKIYVNNELKYDSGTRIDNKRQEVKIEDSLKKYVPGKVKVVVNVTNTEGSTTSKTTEHDYNDVKNPVCGMVTYEGLNALTSYNSQNTTPQCGDSGYQWIRDGQRNAWIVCNDEFGVGCAQHEFSQRFITEGEDEAIIVRDKNGNLTECPVKKCIDKTTPKVTVKLFKSTSTGEIEDPDNPIKTFTAPSQNAIQNYTLDYTSPDWISSVNFPNGVIIQTIIEDATLSSGASGINSYSWYHNAAGQLETNLGPTNIKVDAQTSFTTKTYKKAIRITEDGVRKEVIKVSDKVGNNTTYNLILKIDLHPPVCKEQTGGNKTWSNAAKVTVGRNCYDAFSSCTKSNYTVDVSDQVKTKNVSITIQDNAGNKVDCSGDYNIYLDRTPPTITNLKTTNDGFTISAKIGDSLSGLKSYQFEGQSSKSASGASQDVSVNAGTTDSNGKLKLTVYDQANNSSTGTATGVYVLCSKTIDKDNFSIYHWKNMTKHCNSYYRKYDFEQYSCDCKMDKKDDGYVCSHKVKDITIEGHGGYTSVIYYHHTDNGEAACKGEKYPNSYIDQVCASDNWFAGDDDWGYHGYRFFDGAASGKWLEFDTNGWTYWGKHMIDVNKSASAACKQACEYKYD